MKRIALMLLLTLIFSSHGIAQEEFVPGNYFHDKTILNPGFSSAAEDPVVTATARNFLYSWPLGDQFLHANFYTRLGDERHSLYSSIYMSPLSPVGPINNIRFRIGYTHTIPLGKWKISGGAAAQYQMNYRKDLLTPSGYEEAHISYLTYDLHLLLRYANWFAGISADELFGHILSHSHNDRFVLRKSLLYSAGGKINISENFNLSPVLFLKIPHDGFGDVEGELSLEAELFDKLHIGTGLYLRGITAMAGWEIDRFTISYVHQFLFEDYSFMNFHYTPYGNYFLKVGYNLPDKF